ncbi:ABC transporter permease [Rhizobium johnstonii]|jgi:putative spermidine/putrescine transport system permease protein|uniref:ABC transporter permease n=1 Tax=Rhizobium leguminosarum TaxID=384 RepID=A0A4Q8XRW3_RHILE|nr:MULTISPECIES: ABC transporter permease [Rhizobium]MDV4165977.1 ABC transporter permease [Rhizobium leguminosarum]MDV4176529.1 ABC transporter permease [Rhizobium leguminosarum]OAV51113.1 ABC transporter permease [Rhizobium sp. WYCCWR10014]QIO56058.1 ABC transporter permease [Rhizobium leguminosarum bv. trifolii]QIO70368.1 ABC transporter permease [Rhizobium leguminosarum bv. trifolii]
MRTSNLLLYGFVALVLAWLIIPIIIIVPMSFSSARFLTFPPPSWSLRWYEAYLGNAAWMQATRVSLIVSVSSAILATVLGTAAAYALNMTSSRLVRSLQMLLLLPLVVPIVITAVGVFLVYAQVGLLASMTGLILANMMLGLPYVVISVLVGLRKFDATQEMVSRSLGMNRLRTFFVVTLPQIRPSVISGMLFAFISAIDETVVSLFISGGEYQTLTKRMFTALRDEIDPTIAAISSLLTATSFILVMLVALNARSADRKQGKVA